MEIKIMGERTNLVVKLVNTDGTKHLTKSFYFQWGFGKVMPMALLSALMELRYCKSVQKDMFCQYVQALSKISNSVDYTSKRKTEDVFSEKPIKVGEGKWERNEPHFWKYISDNNDGLLLAEIKLKEFRDADIRVSAVLPELDKIVSLKDYLNYFDSWYNDNKEKFEDYIKTKQAIYLLCEHFDIKDALTGEQIKSEADIKIPEIKESDELPETVGW